VEKGEKSEMSDSKRKEGDGNQTAHETCSLLDGPHIQSKLLMRNISKRIEVSYIHISMKYT
jgi:hypothetical protein